VGSQAAHEAAEVANGSLAKLDDWQLSRKLSHAGKA
jgi:hypothetical protein